MMDEVIAGVRPLIRDKPELATLQGMALADRADRAWRRGDSLAADTLFRAAASFGPNYEVCAERAWWE